MTAHPHRAEHVISVFEGRSEARRAMVDLERHGVEAGRVRLVSDATGPNTATAAARRARMMGETRPVARHLIAGGLLGGVVGAALVPLFVMAIVSNPLTTTLLVSIAGGALAGAAAGAFIAAAMSIPSNEEAFVIQAGEGPVTLRVHVEDPDEREVVLSVLEGHDADRVDVA